MSTVQPSGRPRIAIITRSIDRSRNSGSGHHLHEMVRHLIPQASDLDIHLAHYQDSDDPIYDLAPEIRLPANPLRAAAVLNRHEVDVVHFSPLTIVFTIRLPQQFVYAVEPNRFFPFSVSFQITILVPLYFARALTKSQTVSWSVLRLSAR